MPAPYPAIIRPTWVHPAPVNGTVRASVGVDHVAGIESVEWSIGFGDSLEYLCNTDAEKTANPYLHGISFDTDRLLSKNLPYVLQATAFPKGDGLPRTCFMPLCVSAAIPEVLEPRKYTVAELRTRKPGPDGWVNLMGQPGTVIDATSPRTSDNRWLKSAPKVRLSNLFILGRINGPPTPSELICEDVAFIGTLPNGKLAESPFTGWSRQWVRRCSATDYANGFGGASVFDCTISRVTCDSLQNATCVVGCTISDIDRGDDLGRHSDVLQWISPADNCFIYGVKAIENVKGMGFGTGEKVSNVSIIRCKVANTGGGNSFSLCDETNHLSVRESNFNGGSCWLRAEKPPTYNFTADGVQFHQSTFNGQPAPQYVTAQGVKPLPDGVTVR
jgi:hypothetical protein